MSRVKANIWGRVLIRNKLITQGKWDFVIGEYFDQGAKGSIGQWLVDAGYINVKQMQQIAKVVDKVVNKSQPAGTEVQKMKETAPTPEPVPEMADEPEPDPKPVEPVEPIEPAGEPDFIDLEPEREEDDKIEITDLSELRSKVTSDPVSNPVIEAATKIKPKEASSVDSQSEEQDDEDDGQYDLAGPVPTDDEAQSMRVSEVDWHAEDESKQEFKIDDSERISLEGDDEDDD